MRVKNKESRLNVKLLQVALQKQDYNLAAHVLVYGLVKARAKYSKNCYGKGSKKQGKE